MPARTSSTTCAVKKSLRFIAVPFLCDYLLCPMTTSRQPLRAGRAGGEDISLVMHPRARYCASANRYCPAVQFTGADARDEESIVADGIGAPLDCGVIYP